LVVTPIKEEEEGIGSRPSRFNPGERAPLPTEGEGPNGEEKTPLLLTGI